MPTKPPPPRYRRGDVVAFQFGPNRAISRIIELRGPLGVNRRHLYRLRVFTGSDEPFETEMPEEELEPAIPTRNEVREYLATGGLVDILSRNQGGGPNPPRVWLTYNPVGELTHTFIEENGLLGGGVIPFFSLAGRKIFKPEAEQVVHFLESFGLNPADAEEVVRRVGVS